MDRDDVGVQRFFPDTKVAWLRAGWPSPITRHFSCRLSYLCTFVFLHTVTWRNRCCMAKNFLRRRSLPLIPFHALPSLPFTSPHTLPSSEHCLCHSGLLPSRVTTVIALRTAAGRHRKNDGSGRGRIACRVQGWLAHLLPTCYPPVICALSVSPYLRVRAPLRACMCICVCFGAASPLARACSDTPYTLVGFPHRSHHQQTMAPRQAIPHDRGKVYDP